MLCAVIHGVPEETHGPGPAPAASSTMAADGEQHGPHVPHGAEDCPSDRIVRTAAPSAEDLPLAAIDGAVVVAVSAPVRRPLARHGPRNRRSARTGRVALVRTSRWRI
ncbi:hypothetical protein J7F01_32600 [Streptomyces sp. ISL-22]|nr:hypothetical protein [Streptomyces sp. ISL-24]MBT2436812.1 hypothetical protein [Streptomyces sp. ISL-22]